MISISQDLEDILTNTLQKKISLEIDGKVFKTGKLLLYTTKYFFLCLTMQTAKKSREKVEIPIPYNIETHPRDNLIYFDYRNSTLSKSNEAAKELIDKLGTSKSKYYNKILTIEIQNDSKL